MFLEQAIADAEIRPDTNVQIVLDMLYGSVFFRLLMGHGKLTEALIKQLLTEALRGLHPHR
jgi:hypothetical protein